ncbi:hypothetical protein Tco_0262055 [Tanacetum coccineum]
MTTSRHGEKTNRKKKEKVALSGALEILTIIGKNKTLEREAPTFAITTRSGASTHTIIDVHEGKLSLKVGNETVTFNIGKSIKSKYSSDDYLHCIDHTMKLIREQWVDTVDHDGEWMEAEEGKYLDEVRAFSFYPRAELVEPLEWKALENRLKPSSVEPPTLELKELPEHLEYAFLQENNQLPIVISSAHLPSRKDSLLEVLGNHKGAHHLEYREHMGIDSSFSV